MKDHQIEKLQFLLKAIIDLIKYSQDISLSHKKHIDNCYKAFEKSFSPPTPAENQDPEQ